MPISNENDTKYNYDNTGEDNAFVGSQAVVLKKRKRLTKMQLKETKTMVAQLISYGCTPSTVMTLLNIDKNKFAECYTKNALDGVSLKPVKRQLVQSRAELAAELSSLFASMQGDYVIYSYSDCNNFITLTFTTKDTVMHDATALLKCC